MNQTTKMTNHNIKNNTNVVQAQNKIYKKEMNSLIVILNINNKQPIKIGENNKKQTQHI